MGLVKKAILYLTGLGEIKAILSLIPGVGEDEDDEESSSSSSLLPSLGGGKTFTAIGEDTGKEVKVTYYPGDKRIEGDVSQTESWKVENKDATFRPTRPNDPEADYYNISKFDKQKLDPALGISESGSSESSTSSSPRNSPASQMNNLSADSQGSNSSLIDLSSIGLPGGTAVTVFLLALSIGGIIAASVLLSPIVGIGIGGGLAALIGLKKFFGMKAFISTVTFLAAGVAVLFVISGTAHGALINDMLGGTTSGLGDTFEGVGYQINKIASTLGCFGNAGCIREWQMNNTQQPGSEDVGETYRLAVHGPRITGSNDVRYKAPDSKIPITFTVENIRHGLKGIEARNVKYRLMVRNPQVFSAGKGRCKTGWMPLNRVGDDNTLQPGETAQPLNYAGDKRLSIKECGLLNPVNTNVMAILQIKYDYSAMSFLKLEAMSSKNFKGVPQQKNSKTPNTPVESSIHAQNPVLYSGSTAIPFIARFSVGTDQKNLKFRARPSEFRLTASDLVEKTKNCDGLKKMEKGENKFTFSKKIAERIRNRIEDGGWFSKQIKYPTGQCNFKLKKPERISPTGETLTFSASVNYTVKQETFSQGFNMRNTLCRTMNCPQIRYLTADHLKNGGSHPNLMNIDLDRDSPINNGSKDYSTRDYWRKENALCNRPQDAQPGCSVVDGWSYSERTNPLDVTIGEGRFAIKISKEMKYLGKNFLSCYLKNKSLGDIVGIRKEDLNQIYKDNKIVLNRTQGGTYIKTRLRPSDRNPSNCSMTMSGRKIKGASKDSSTDEGTTGETNTGNTDILNSGGGL